MNGDPNYALEKLSHAVDVLATGPEEIRKRLFDAFMVFHPVSERDFPETLKPHYRWLISELTKYESAAAGTKYDEGRVKATLGRIRKKTGVEIAKKILFLQFELELHCQQDSDQ